MKIFIIEFLHVEGDVRSIKIEAYDLERAKLRFIVNWGKEMKILKIFRNEKFRNYSKAV